MPEKGEDHKIKKKESQGLQQIVENRRMKKQKNIKASTKNSKSPIKTETKCHRIFTNCSLTLNLNLNKIYVGDVSPDMKKQGKSGEKMDPQDIVQGTGTRSKYTGAQHEEGR